jgi:aerobic carbon-monoxide dehydrogenase medium subunit
MFCILGEGPLRSRCYADPEGANNVKPARFEYHAPTSVDEAVALLETYGDDAKVLGGGQSLVPMLALRLTRFDHLVDLNRIPTLQFISRNGEWLSIGAMTRQAAAEHDAAVATSAPLLAKAIPHIGHFQIRNRGTIGGSIAHADPASELPAVALALDAEIELLGPRGTRRVLAAEFFLSMWETAATPEEIVVAVHFPVAAAHTGFGFSEMALRLGDFAITGAACVVTLADSGAVERAAIGLMGMDVTPIRAREAETALVGARPEIDDLAEIAAIAVATANPTDDVHASARYRSKVGAVMVERSLRVAIEEATRG